MIEAYAVPDVRAVEDLARAELPDGELMQRAARGLAEVVLARLDDPEGDASGSVVALVGRGDNGGDALYATVLLAQAGVSVAAITSGRVADEAVDLAREVGVVVVSADEGEDAAGGGAPDEREAADEGEAPDETEAADEGDADTTDIGWRDLLAEASVVIDGLLGIGGRPGLRAPARALVDAVPADAWVVAVDLPSGADPAGEQVADDLVVADETVTFSLVKPVHLLPASEPAVGRLTVVDIGLDDALQRSGVRAAVERLTFDDVPDLWPVPGASSDKYSRGVVGIVAGSVAYPGAAVLSVLGALGAGPGMIRYLGPRDVRWLVHQAAPEVVTAPGRVQAWVIGSGFDVTPGERAPDDAKEQRERALEALAGDLPVLVDAGALELVDRRDAPTLLTPHAGELARLLTRLGVSVDERDTQDERAAGDEQDKQDAEDERDADGSVRDRPPGEVTREQVTRAPLAHARAAARRTGCTVLLKGATTLVVDPDGSVPVRAQHDAPAWIATAGAGDVLGGLCGTLLAAGLTPRDAGSLGALVHGVAADRASGGGPLRIRDVAREVGPAVRALLTRL